MNYTVYDTSFDKIRLLIRINTHIYIYIRVCMYVHVWEHVHNRHQKYMTNNLFNIRALAFKDTYVLGYTTCTRNILIYIYIYI